MDSEHVAISLIFAFALSIVAGVTAHNINEDNNMLKIELLKIESNCPAKEQSK